MQNITRGLTIPVVKRTAEQVWAGFH